jgi:hypothetical protein
MFHHYLAEDLPEAQAQDVLSLCAEMVTNLGSDSFIRQSRALRNRTN